MKTWTKRTIAVCLLLALLLTAIPCASAKQYTDVTRSALPDYFDAINYVTDNGIMNGVSTSSFSPNEMVTRAMFITTLYRYAGSPSSFAAVSFTDISSSHYAYNAVKWGVKYNIVTGTTTTTFSPDEQVTREQAMTFLWRYLKNYVGGTPYYYGSISGCGDYSSIYDYARTPMYWAVSNAIIFASGSSKLLYPKAGVYRKELALWITRYGCNVDGIRFGKDNFSFTNTSSSFASFGKTRLLLSRDYYNKLYALAGNDDERDEIELRSNERWSGVCFGMALSALLDKKGVNAFNEKCENNCKTMYAIKKPTTSSTQHIMVSDRLDGTSFTKTENTINYYYMTQFLWSRMPYNEVYLNKGESLAQFVSDLRKYGTALVSFHFGDTAPLTGHAIMAYGMPKRNSSGGYDITFYDPNTTTKQTMTISSDYKSCTIPHNGNNVSAKIICYYVDFYSFTKIDIDGDYNVNSAKGTESVSNADELNSMWIALDPDGEYRITNAEGNILEYKNLEFSGDMQVLEHHIVGVDTEMPRFYCRILRSDTFTIELLRGASFFNTIWSDTSFSKVSGTGIERIVVTPETLTVKGDSMDYMIRYYADNTSDNLVVLTGSAEDAISVAQTDQLSVTCNSEYNCVVKQLGGDVLDEHTGTGGEFIALVLTDTEESSKEAA